VPLKFITMPTEVTPREPLFPRGMPHLDSISAPRPPPYIHSAAQWAREQQEALRYQNDEVAKMTRKICTILKFKR
jgi:hypothetical protein